MLRFPFALLACSLGCASPDVGDMAARFAAGDIANVRSELDALAVEESSDAHLWLMNRAAANLAAGDPKAGIAALRVARDRLDALRARSYAGWIEAVLSDDRALIYDGADYEHVLVRAYLALLDIASGEGDVVPYLLQMLQRQIELREAFVTDDGERPKTPLRSAVIGNWLLAALAADDPTRRGDVERQLNSVLEHEPGCAVARAELARFSRDGLCKPGHGVVQVVAMVGLGPYRVARDEPVSSIILDFAHRIYNARRERVAIPISAISQVQIADLAVHTDNPSEVHVAVGGERRVTETVTSVEALAKAEFDNLRAQIVIRAVVRRIFKLAASEFAKSQTTDQKDRDQETAQTRDKQAQDGKRVARPGETEEQRKQRQEEERRRRKQEEREQLGSVAWDLIAWLWIALESADTRCWALLPASFQVARLELPEGDHDVVLRACDRGQVVGAEQRVAVRVRAGRSTFVIAQVPSRHGGPAPVTSEPASAPVAPDLAAPATDRSRLRFQ